MSILDPVLEQVAKIWAELDDLPVFRWGTVTQASPLRVTLDGDSDPITPQTAVVDLTVGVRVVCIEQNLRVLVVAAHVTPPPALPASWTGYGPDTSTISAAAATWQDAGTSVVFTPPRPLEVLCLYGAQIVASGSSTGTYGMVGVQATGALALEPEIAQETNTVKWALTPFTMMQGVTVMGSKRLILPPGAATTLVLRKRRNLTTMAPSFSYPVLTVIPERWV